MNCTVTQGSGDHPRGVGGFGGTWQEAGGFVSPMLGDRTCSREVMDRSRGREASDLHTLNPATTLVMALKFTNGAHTTQSRYNKDNHPRGN